MKIKSAQYISISQTPFGEEEQKVNVTIKVIEEQSDGQMLQHFVPISENNRHYLAIVEWAKEDGNEIAAAD
tara:strand:+ start:964 stop:1176 length:213 start_codon:yes stop_codon:yes gene_type:complete